MVDMTDTNAELKVGAHVLVQLGSELVTDVEQAILECVKNAYDADAPGCLIEILTREVGTRFEVGKASKLRGFDKPAEGVTVEILDHEGVPLQAKSGSDGTELATRKLTYIGRITIEDKGNGLEPDQLRTSWLVVSRSSKRGVVGGQKPRTKKGRTPLGDKGLGRLGSMKLGDILRIETSTSPSNRIAVAQFRWADCESARTVDEIPVFLDELENIEGFKGTRVSVLGLRDLPEWRRKGRISEITRSLARLISPFEATSTFPVGIRLDGDEHSLVSVTDELLRRAVAEFQFQWGPDPEAPDKHVLVATARFRKRLFTSKRSEKNRVRTAVVFEKDGGVRFAEWLNSCSRLKPYRDKSIDLDGEWFIELQRSFQWVDMQLDTGAAIADPGPFSGAFYFFHLDRLDPEDEEGAVDVDAPAAAGIGIDRKLLKDMTGISVLRDGFRVRSQGDWLGLSQTMTSGSTYGMRVDNTIGYFALSGAHNYRLVEKSDREGFVEDAAYRGFMQIAKLCRGFANESLEQVRRALDEHYKHLQAEDDDATSASVLGSFQALETGLKSAEDAHADVSRIAGELQADLEHLERQAATPDSGPQPVRRALEVANRAIAAMYNVQAKLSSGARAGANLVRLRKEFDERDDQTMALFESAAVGLTARGLAHELRTHLSEIKHQASAIEQASKQGECNLAKHLRAIRASCAAISNAASLIDPMLPRSRSLRESIPLRAFVEEYFRNRASVYERSGIRTTVSGAGAIVRVNRPRLTQVLDNLVRNSAYWLRRGEITGQVNRAKEISVELTQFGFLVSDTGPGVEPHYEESLFELFVTSKPDRDSGQGLGLFIVRELLRADGCDITLQPERNADGRRFRFLVNLGAVVVRS